MQPPHDRPVKDALKTYASIYAAITHPAFRLGFLDAMKDLPFNHDNIMHRIQNETPTGALVRLGWIKRGFFSPPNDDEPSLLDEEKDKTVCWVSIAQWRYEEGRKLYMEFGVRCKAWGHPDYPPAQVERFARAWADKQRE